MLERDSKSEDRMTFAEFFKTATKHDPFDYQCRLACGDVENARNAVSGTGCE